MKIFKAAALAMLAAMANMQTATPNAQAGTRQAAEAMVAAGSFSLLTCTPGDKIYELFGHTALRYNNPETGDDLVFNYGTFSFSAPNFIWRFVKGETDYELNIGTFDRFWAEYYNRGSAIYEQKLELDENQKWNLLSMLAENHKPRNRVYRYNFFYDNCTTRARDKIEEAIGTDVGYDKETQTTSFRKIIHEYCKGHEWSKLGMDICIGSEADKTLNEREAMFAPLYYMDYLDNAFAISPDGEKAKIAQQPETIADPSPKTEQSLPPSPMLAFALLLAITTAVTAAELKTGKTLWGYDIFLFGSTGLCGMVIAFLVFFSSHPATSPNYMLVFMHPLHLLLLPAFIYKEAKGRKSLYHLANSVALAMFFALMFIIPQQFNNAILLLALSLLIRSSCYTLKTKCKKPTTD